MTLTVKLSIISNTGARCGIKAARRLYVKSMRNFLPEFHITGERGWINDPNGLIVFGGEYHVFFQYHPHSVKWGPMYWGHVKSRDLTHWERLPIALSPDENEDGCFSGSAIAWRDKLWLLYTGCKENDGKETVRQLQCLASSDDGVNFVKHGVVIGEDDLPKEYSPSDFRDPKVFESNGAFYCVVAARRRDGRGRILLFKSQDLFKWEFVRDVLGKDSGGIMTECPDYRDDIGLLVYSEQNQPASGKTHLNLHSTFARVGRLTSGGFESSGESEIVDYGFDFYAPQTFCGAPVMIGWLNMWERTNPSEKFGFSGQLSVPRKIEVRGGGLYQTPIFERKLVRTESTFKTLDDKLLCGSIKLEIEDLKALDIKLRKDDYGYASFSLVGDEWIFDRSKAGDFITGAETDEDSRAGIRRMPFVKRKRTEIEIVSDLYSVEIFVDGKALSSTLYPSLNADGLKINIDCGFVQYNRYDVAKDGRLMAQTLASCE